jgi:hypothetical protein
MTQRMLLLLPPLMALAFLAGCSSPIDPYERPGVWRPSDSISLNLELQVARPTDLVQGRGTLAADGETAVAAIERLRKDKVRTLPTASISGVGGGSNGASGTTQ